MRLKYFSHSSFQLISNDEVSILIDPFFDDNPTSPVKADAVRADYIILTHAHGDHCGDAIKIAKRCNSTIICVYELAMYFSELGLQTHPMHIGGGHNFEFGRLKFTIAMHGSETPDHRYAGLAAGVIIKSDDITLYHCGDTGLFYDMKLIGEMNRINYMLLPIGDNFTMGIEDAIKAVELVNPQIAIPMHYNTFPIISADPFEFKQKLEELNRRSMVLEYGQEIEL